jgi:hypothetical protein
VRRDVGLWIWPGDDTSVFTVEVCWFLAISNKL